MEDGNKENVTQPVSEMAAVVARGFTIVHPDHCANSRTGANTRYVHGLLSMNGVCHIVYKHVKW